MPCLGPADLQRVADTGILNVPGAAEHVAGCADCAAAIGAAVRVARTDDAPAEQLGRYQILGERGRGAFGRVFEAYDPALDRRVAVKMIAFTRAASADALAELLREAKAMAQIQHANVVPIFDAGRADDAVFITMPIVDGETLDAWAARERAAGTLDPDRVLASIGRKIAAGLTAIHAAGFVHRDLKPSNILVAGTDAFVADLGLARRTTRATTNTDAFAESALLSSMHTASFAGTPAYMAPECLAGEAATPASDQYALAATLVEVVTGHRPFEARTYWALHEAARTMPPRLDGVPKRYRAALSRALHPDPARRFSSITAFATAIVEARAPSRRTWRIAVLALVPALVVGAGWWWSARDKSIAAAPTAIDAAMSVDAAVVVVANDAPVVANDAPVVANDAPVVAVAPIDAAAIAHDMPRDAASPARSRDVPRDVPGDGAATARPRDIAGDAASTAHTRDATGDGAATARLRDAPRDVPGDAAAPPRVEPADPAPPARTCASAEGCRRTYLRCRDTATTRLSTFEEARKRGWADCAAANTACKANHRPACGDALTRCNVAVAADYERGSERVQQDEARCLDERNACLACREP